MDRIMRFTEYIATYLPYFDLELHSCISSTPIGNWVALHQSGHQKKKLKKITGVGPDICTPVGAHMINVLASRLATAQIVSKRSFSIKCHTTNRTEPRYREIVKICARYPRQIAC